MNDDLTFRLSCIYAAIEESQEFDLTTIKVEAVVPSGGIMRLDFSGGKSNATIMNRATDMIHNIANFDNLENWATAKGKNPQRVMDTFPVIDSNNKTVGQLHELCQKALTAWEGLLKEYGVDVGPANG